MYKPSIINLLSFNLKLLKTGPSKRSLDKTKTIATLRIRLLELFWINTDPN